MDKKEALKQIKAGDLSLADADDKEAKRKKSLGELGELFGIKALVGLGAWLNTSFIPIILS